MRNIFFFDIDGTLLDTSNGVVSLPKNLTYTLNRLRALGHILVACTARPKLFIEQLLPNLFDCSILLNGSYVNAGKKILIDEPISQERLLQLKSYFNSINVGYIFIGNYSCWANNISLKYKKLLDDIYMVGDGYTLFSPYTDKDVYTVDLFFKSSHEYARIYPIIDADQKFTLNYNQGDFTGDISFRDKNKSTAIHSVLKYFDININNAFAFGDSMNDYDVFQIVPNTCAVGNADQRLKEIATITSKNYAGFGVLEGLSYWGFVSDILY